MMFDDGPRTHLDANKLVIQIQPAEGIQLHFQTKVPDAGMKLRSTDLDFKFCREFAGRMPDAYQRLLLDAMNGDASLFARSDEVEVAWSIIDPILAAWQSPAAPPLETYPTGDWGPTQQRPVDARRKVASGSTSAPCCTRWRRTTSSERKSDNCS